MAKWQRLKDLFPKCEKIWFVSEWEVLTFVIVENLKIGIWI